MQIESTPWTEMVAHAEATYPNECCGAMLGIIDGDRKTVPLLRIVSWLLKWMLGLIDGDQKTVPLLRIVSRLLKRMLGLIDGDQKTVQVALRLDNAAEGSQRAYYELRPEDLLRADREARERKMDLIGIYHSHPDCDAYFSQTDLKNSCPWYSFVVLSIQKGRFDHANSWLPNAEQTAAEEEELTWQKS